MDCAERADYRISIHAPRTGSDDKLLKETRGEVISIHAPRTGSDDSIAPTGDVHGISIHAPRTGSDKMNTNSFRGS